MESEGLELADDDEAPGAKPNGPATDKGGKKDDTAEPEPSEQELVKLWLQRVATAKKASKRAFEQMKKNEYFATHGADKAWKSSKNYTVAILNRHINQAVAHLYARDPVAEAKPRKKMRYAIWDGRQDTLQAALTSAGSGDPMAMAVINDVMTARQTESQVAKTGQTLEILWDYFTSQQDNGFRKQFKALVRRAKVDGVGYVKLAFQRALEPRPEITARIEDATSMLAAIERLAEEDKEGEIEDPSAKKAELESLVGMLKDQESVIVREGPVYDFPRATKVIVDPDCIHLKTFTGARWIAQEFDFTDDEVQEIYGIELPTPGSGEGSDMPEQDPQAEPLDTSTAARKRSKRTRRVYEIQDKKNTQFLTVCQGYEGFLKKPAEPDVKVNRFFTIFPLVFNEIESEEELYPPSDVELLVDTQEEYNRLRQGLREHRRANRPKYVAARGVLTDEDIAKLSAHPANALIELASLKPDGDVNKLLQRFQPVGIDPNQYNAQDLFSDIERIVGTQQANLGTGSNTTATETSIVEQGRQAGLSDALDDLDECLSDLADATGQVLMLEMSVEMVKKIAGPGAVWPDAPPSRQELSENVYLDIKAGSSGRPNRAVEIANIERVLPLLLQVPAFDPKPLVERIAFLLDIDVEKIQADEVPSVMAQNAIAAQPPGPPSGPGQTPNGGGAPSGAAPPGAQGPAGHMNAPAVASAQPGPRAGMPAQRLPA